MTNLNTILDNIKNLPKPNSTKNISLNLNDTIRNKIEEIKKIIQHDYNDINKYEIEVRIGTLVINDTRIKNISEVQKCSFINGISKTDFERLWRGYCKKGQISNSTNYMYQNKIRYEVESKKFQHKQKVYQTHIPIPNANYDVRICVCKEIDIDTIHLQQEGYRKKERLSVKQNNCSLDITKVNTNRTISYEVEIEIEDNRNINTQDIYMNISELLSLEDLRNVLIPIPDKSIPKHKFMMPINIRRCHLEDVINSDTYYVSEKTDGVRYMLTTDNETAFLFDRKNNVFTMKDCNKLVDIFGPNCVFDGELVYNISWKRYVYIIFDCIQYKGTSCYDMKFINRLELIQKNIIITYNNYLQTNNIGPHEILSIVMKHFYPVSQITHVINSIEFDGIHRCYHERNIHDNTYKEGNKRYHKCDGLIFAPNITIKEQLNGVKDCYKWKFQDDITIDLKCDNSFNFSYYSDKGDIDFTKHVCLDNFSKYRLNRDLIGNPYVIVELQWVNYTWVYKTVRHDKSKANYSDTVISTLMEIADNIQIDEFIENRKNKRIKIK